MKRAVFYGRLGKTVSIGLLVFVLLSAGCDNGGGDPESELAAWNGTWNSIHNYYDDADLAPTLQAQNMMDCRKRKKMRSVSRHLTATRHLLNNWL